MFDHYVNIYCDLIQLIKLQFSKLPSEQMD